MPEDALDPSQMPLAQLVECCTAERAKFRQHEPSDPRYCLEVFRRTLRSGTDAEWAALYSCFYQDVLRWVQFHPVMRSAQLPEMADGYAVEAFECMLIANRNHPLDVSSLGAILTFLRRCVSSVLLDAVRAMRKEVSLDEIHAMPGPDESEHIIGAISRDELWQMVEQCVAQPRELRLARALWIEGYRPREITQVLPEDFSDIHEVRRCIANIIDRLRRRYRPQSA